MRLSVRGFYLATALALAATPAAAQFNGYSGIFALNTQTFGLRAPPTLTAPGSGYAPSDTVTLTCPGLETSTTTAATLTITSIGAGGAITGVSLTNPGTYTSIPSSGLAGTLNGTCAFTQAATSGSGSGATFSGTFAFIAANSTALIVLPTPTQIALGGVFAANAPTNQLQYGIATTGAPEFRALIAADIAGLAASLAATTVTDLTVTDLTGYVYCNASSSCTAATQVPISTGISGLGTGIATALAAAPTGSGSLVAATSPTISSPTVTGTLAGATETLSGTLTPTGGIVGVTNGSAAAAGTVGEYASNTVSGGSAIGITSGVAQNIASLSLTAGDWNCQGNIGYVPGSGTVQTSESAWISLTSAAIPTTPNSGAYTAINATGSATVPLGFLTIGNFRVNISTTTTVYLEATSTFTVSTNAAYGFIGCRRVR